MIDPRAQQKTTLQTMRTCLRMIKQSTRMPQRKATPIRRCLIPPPYPRSNQSQRRATFAHFLHLACPKSLRVRLSDAFG